MRSGLLRSFDGETTASVPPGTLGECALDALIFGAALLCHVSPRPPVSGLWRHTHAAARMELQASCRRAGLIATPPRQNLFERFDVRLALLARAPADANPRILRRLMVLTMGRLVGSQWAAIVHETLARIAVISGRPGPLAELWLDRMREALALPPPRAARA